MKYPDPTSDVSVVDFEQWQSPTDEELVEAIGGTRPIDQPACAETRATEMGVDTVIIP